MEQFSPSALDGILNTFKLHSTEAASLRAFISDALQPIASSSENPPRTNQTKQAFADACRVVLANFDHWVADLEASFALGIGDSTPSKTISGVSAATTPLLLNLELESAFGNILEHLSAFLSQADSPIILLDTLFATIEAIRPSCKPEEVKPLISVFVQTAAPLWAMLGEWINRGMPIPDGLNSSEDEYLSTIPDEERSLNAEFFIRRDRDVSWADGDFWDAGYVDIPVGWPVWLSQGNTREDILQCGKARGLLRGLVGIGERVDEWRNLPDVLTRARECDGDDTPSSDIATAISTYLQPICQLTQIQLRRVFEDDCGRRQHLDAIEGVMYMRGFVVMDEWSRWLSIQVGARRPLPMSPTDHDRQLRTGQRWTDFHILTGTLRDIIESEGEMWMNPAVIRIRADRRIRTSKGVKALSHIRADYQVSCSILANVNGKPN